MKVRHIFLEKGKGNSAHKGYDYLELEDGHKRRLTRKEKENLSLLPDNSKVFSSVSLESLGSVKKGQVSIFRVKVIFLEVTHIGRQREWSRKTGKKQFDFCFWKHLTICYYQDEFSCAAFKHLDRFDGSNKHELCCPN